MPLRLMGNPDAIPPRTRPCSLLKYHFNGIWQTRFTQPAVILSGVTVSHRETVAQSKDPYRLPNPLPGFAKGNDQDASSRVQVRQAARDPSTPSDHSQANDLTPLGMTAGNDFCVPRSQFRGTILATWTISGLAMDRTITPPHALAGLGWRWFAPSPCCAAFRCPARPTTVRRSKNRVH